MPTTWGLAWALAASISPGIASGVRHDGDRIVRAHPGTAQELQALLEIADEVWTERVGVGPIDVRVSAHAMAALDASGIDYEVRIADVQAAVDLEAERLAARTTEPAAAPEWFSDFRDLAAIEAFVDALASDHPDLVSIEPLGDSLEGRPIRALQIGTPGPGKVGVLYTGTMHAREWLSPMVVTCIADAIATGAGTDPRIDDILQAVVLFVVPVLNPDGYAYSWAGDRYWRKNVRGGHGVDLNRNFGYAWGGQGASPDPWSENYHGAGPFSEPESTALRDFAIAHSELVAHVDVHSYANLIIYPWGYGYDTAPDEPVLAALAAEMAGGMAEATGAIYQPIQGADFYPAAGAVDDWSYGERGMMAFTIELRGDDFVVPPTLIEPACEESLEAALVLAEWAVAQADPDVPPSDDGASDHGDDAGAESDGSGADEGPAGGGDDADDGDAAGDVPADDGDAGGDGPGAAGPDPALPWDYGEDTTACTCTAPADAPGRAWMLGLCPIVVVALRGRSRARTARGIPGSRTARAPRARASR